MIGKTLEYAFALVLIGFAVVTIASFGGCAPARDAVVAGMRTDYCPTLDACARDPWRATVKPQPGPRRGPSWMMRDAHRAWMMRDAHRAGNSEAVR